MDNLHALKIELREGDFPFFNEEDLRYYLNKNNDNLSSAIYECALIKANSPTVTLGSGLKIEIDKSMFLGIASKHEPIGSRVI